jgi:hypothetical protein
MLYPRPKITIHQQFLTQRGLVRRKKEQCLPDNDPKGPYERERERETWAYEIN